VKKGGKRHVNQYFVKKGDCNKKKLGTETILNSDDSADKFSRNRARIRETHFKRKDSVRAVLRGGGANEGKNFFKGLIFKDLS